MWLSSHSKIKKILGVLAQSEFTMNQKCNVVFKKKQTQFEAALYDIIPRDVLISNWIRTDDECVFMLGRLYC